VETEILYPIPCIGLRQDHNLISSSVSRSHINVYLLELESHNLRRRIVNHSVLKIYRSSRNIIEN